MNIVLIGDGGHSKVIQDIIFLQQDDVIVGILDDKYQESIIKEDIHYGPIHSIHQLVSKYKDLKFVIAVGNNQARKKIADKLPFSPKDYITCIHPSAIVSPSAKVGNGTVVMANAVINAATEVGHHCIINTASILEHDNGLEDYIHVSPSATLTGDVKVKEGAHIGAGSTIIPNMHIGEWSVVGAGATVIEDVPAYSLAAGVPATIKKSFREVGLLG
jgi:acetyltransferase EpsM